MNARSVHLVFLLALSSAVHAGAYFSLPGRLSLPAPRLPEGVELEVLEEIATVDDAIEDAPVAAPAPEPKVEQVEAPEPSTPKMQPRVASPKPTASPEPPPEAEAPVSFDDITLTNDAGNSSWQSEVGSGKASKGPIGPPGRATGRKAAGVAGGTGTGGGQGGGSPVVALSNLSKPPKDPNLGAKLERNFPSQAKSQGVEGIAKVKLRVNASGSVQNLRVVSESAKGYGFGSACVKTLKGSRWSPPLDKTGKAVATIVTYTCDFRVRF